MGSLSGNVDHRICAGISDLRVLPNVVTRHLKGSRMSREWLLPLTQKSARCTPKNLHGCLKHGFSFMSLLPLLKCTTLSHCTHILCLVFINIQHAQFFPHEGLRWCIFALIYTSMSDAISSDCPSAAISHPATKCSGILVGRALLPAQLL